MHKAEPGDRARIQCFRLSEPGDVIGKRRGQKTWEFTVGSSEVFPALSSGVIGMTPGERKRLTLQPNEAYGEVRSKLIRRLPRERFPQDLVLKVGKRLRAVNATSGRRRRVRVVEIQPDSVLLNGNHPLAGQVLELEVMLLSLDSSPNANKSRPQFDLGGESGEGGEG